jgi:hypothetical protein
MTSPDTDNPAPKGAYEKEPKGAPCPICNRAAKAEYAPFCSKRCADVDLHRWLSGGYAVPAVEEDGGPEDEDEDQG